MEAKEFLKRYKKYETLIRNKTIELLQCKADAKTITSSWNTERVQGTGNPHKMADAVGKYIDMESELKKHIDDMIDAKKEIVETIEMLKTDQYDVLHRLYIQHMKFKEIAFECEKSESWVATIHGRALKSVQKILDEREVKEA